ncbi:MAG: hypothetical protein AAFQ62_11610 [Pseudomonadota bacterium]
MTRPITILFAAFLMLGALVPTDAEARFGDALRCDRDRLTSFWEQDIAGNALSGRGSVCATNSGLYSNMNVRGLTPGFAYTVWWVYIDRPASCAGVRLTPDNSPVPFPEPERYAGSCGLADFFTPSASGQGLDPLAVFSRMDSAVARNSGRTWFSGDLRGLNPAPGSQVWLFVFGHGAADTNDKRQLARQLLTPEDPGAGVPHLGIEGRPFGYPAGVVVLDF